MSIYIITVSYLLFTCAESPNRSLRVWLTERPAAETETNSAIRGLYINTHTHTSIAIGISPSLCTDLYYVPELNHRIEAYAFDWRRNVLRPRLQHTHTHTCMYTYTYRCRYIYLYIYIDISIHIHIYIYILIDLYVYLSIYICMHTYTHICIAYLSWITEPEPARLTSSRASRGGGWDELCGGGSVAVVTVERRCAGRDRFVEACRRASRFNPRRRRLKNLEMGKQTYSAP